MVDVCWTKCAVKELRKFSVADEDDGQEKVEEEPCITKEMLVDFTWNREQIISLFFYWNFFKSEEVERRM